MLFVGIRLCQCGRWSWDTDWTADEVAVPALGFGPPPLETPASTHASALASHAVYGLTTDLVRRALRRVM